MYILFKSDITHELWINTAFLSHLHQLHELL